MSHTSGFGDGHGFPGYERGKPLPTVLQILACQSPSPLPSVRLVRPAMTICMSSLSGSDCVLPDRLGVRVGIIGRARIYWVALTRVLNAHNN